jgi:Uncharacterised nucleotidyltransferase
VLRRAPFGIPKREQVPELVDLISGRPVEPADPATFLDAVVAHRVTGFADSAIEAGRLLVPRDTARHLRDAHAVASLRSSLHRRELATIVPRIADACGTQPLVFKGPAVAEVLYEPRTLRPFSDLDLLVPRAGAEAATEALRAVGYWPNLHLRPGFGERYRHDIHLSRHHGKHQLGIDLHWRISDDPVGEQLRHERIEPVGLRIDGLEIARPSPAEHLIVLATHFLSDRHRRLLWIEDLRRAALAVDEEQWNLAFERANRRGLCWVLNRALDYAAHHLGLERERPGPPGPPPPWGPIRALEAYEFWVAWDVGHLTSIPWRERPGYLRAMLLPTREGLHGAAADPDTPVWRLALRRARRAFAGIGPGSR